MTRIACAAAGLTLLATPALAVPTPVDLSGWIADGDGTWTTEAGNNAVNQSVNGRPTVFHNQTDSQGTALAGTIEVRTGSDDDFVGFVLGYHQGDIDGLNGSIDYLLIDWKQADQSWDEGLAISRVTGAIDAPFSATGSDVWSHTGNVALITRSNAAGSVYGNAGWDDNTEYLFDISFTSSAVQVFVDGQLEIAITAADAGVAAFGDGAFGFYNYSQQSVRYAGITEVDLPPDVPLPAAAPLLAAGLGALGWAGRRRARRS